MIPSGGEALELRGNYRERCTRRGILGIEREKLLQEEEVLPGPLLAGTQADLGSLTAQCTSRWVFFLHFHLKDEIVRR